MAFLRAVNVGGRRIVTMDRLCAALEQIGLGNVESLGHAGNLLFDAPAAEAGALSGRIARALEVRLGVSTEVIVRTLAQVRRLVAGQPFGRPAAAGETKRYVAFLSAAPRRRPRLPIVSERDGLEVVRILGADVLVISRAVRGRYGFPNLLVEAALGVSTTRNWNTVVKLAGSPGGARGGRGGRAAP